MEHIFISYTQKDSQFAHTLADELARWGIVPCIDNRIDNGRNWPPSIQESIKACPIFIVIMSPESYKPGWVQKEVAYAQSLHKKIFPILLRGVAWNSPAPPQSLDLRNGQMPDRNYYLMLQKVLDEVVPASGQRAVLRYQKVVETLVALAKRPGRWKLGEYIVERNAGFFEDTLIIHLADDRVRYSGGQAIQPNNKANMLGHSQPITFSYQQSNSQYRAGYKMTISTPSKYADAAIEMIKLYQASGLNPFDLLAEPVRES